MSYNKDYSLLIIFIFVFVVFLMGCIVGSRNKVIYDGKEWIEIYHNEKNCNTDLFNNYVECYESVGLKRNIIKTNL